MKNRLLIFTLLNCIIALKSQVYSQKELVRVYERGGFSNIGAGNQSIINYSDINGSIKGHKYFTNSWSSGCLIINDSILSPKNKIQYDMTSGEVILSGKDDSMGFVITDKALTGFWIYDKGKKNVFVRKEKSNFIEDIDRSYFYNPFPELKKEYLIIDYRKKLKEPKISRNSYTTTNQDKFYNEAKINYILGRDGKYIKLNKLNKRKVLKALGSLDKLKKYVKANKIDLKTEKGVVKLLEYYHN